MYRRALQLFSFLAFVFIYAPLLYSQSSSPGFSFFYQGTQWVKKDPAKALIFFEKALNESNNQHDLNSHLQYLNSIVPHYYYSNPKERDKVFEWIKVALANQINRDDTTMASLLYRAGKYYWLYNDSEKSITHYIKSRNIRTRHLGEWNEAVAQCYHGLGDNYKYKTFDFIEAEKCYEKALRIRERINFQEKDILFTNYYGLAATNRSQRDFEKAVAYGLKALSMAEETNEIVLLNHTYGMIANIYRDIQAFDKARMYYQKAIDLHRHTKNGDELLAAHYIRLGEMQKNDSSYSEAMASFSKAKTILDRITVTDNMMMLYGLAQIAETLRLKKDFAGAKHAYKNLCKTLENLNMTDGNQVAEVYLGLGELLKEKGDLDSALFYHQKALVAAVKPFKSMRFETNPTEDIIGTNYFIVHEILNNKASVLKALFLKTKNTSHLKQSLECLLLSEKLLTLRRNNFDIEEAKWRLLESYYNVYEEILSSLQELIQINPQDSLYDLAFRYFEKSKSRTLAEALAEAESKGRVRTDTLFTKQEEIKKQMFSVQERLNKEKNNPDADENRVSTLQEEVVTLDRRMQHIKSAIEEKYPGYFTVKYEQTVPSLSVIQKRNENEGQTVIEYFWGNKSVYGLAISDQKVLFKKLGSSDSLYRIMDKVLQHFHNKGAGVTKEAFETFTIHSHQLYRQFIIPFNSLLIKGRRLQIIPDGPLSQVPFEILLTERSNSNAVNFRDLKYMIHDFPISYAYSSASTMKKIHQRIKRPTLFAMSFSGGTPQTGSMAEIRNSDPSALTEISGTNRELDFLMKKFALGKFLKSDEATEAAFKELASDYDILHLAIHGKGNPQENYSSSLFFKASSDTLEDAELHAYEVYGLKLKARLAVLSACESGLGKVYKGEGMISMASAFAYSGCRNIVMSLWKVDDNASALLVSDFYDRLLAGDNIDRALTNAKLAYLKTADELTADPRIWASLTAYGGMEPIFEKDKSSTILMAATFAAIILLLIFFIRRYRKLAGTT